MLYVDVKYANLLGSHLRNFKKKNEYLWNYSCPVCGDSKSNKLKARGYIYKYKTGLNVKCHNCGHSTNIGNLIKYVDPNLYKEYVLENYKEGAAPRSAHKDAAIAIPEIIKPQELSDSLLEPLKRIDQMPIDHPAVKYIKSRKIPSKHWHLLYYCSKFKKFVNSIKFKFTSEENDTPRLIIPYFNNHGKCFAFQGRAFGNEEPRYMTIKVDENQENIFGLDRVNFAKRIYIVEGPIDSLFIPNCIAVSGSSFTSQTIKSLMSNATVVYDNEPRSKEITKLLNKSINAGYSVCIWPDSVEEKDINEMILAGRTSEDILELIENNTYNGIEAQVRFNQWRKCE